jgi:sugar phosphate isomerase/epimerase
MTRLLATLLLSTAFYVSHAQTGVSREWKLAVQMWTFNTSSFVDGVLKADSCGFKYIEAYPGQVLGGPFSGSMGPGMDTAERHALKAWLKKKGITMLAYGVVDGTDDAKTDQDWRNSFAFARDMGIGELTAMPTAAQLDLVNRLAGSYHIRVAIHDEPGVNAYDHPDSVVRAIKNRSNLGACVDIGNWVRNGVDIVYALKNQLPGRVYSIHLKDVKQAGVVHSPDVVLGQGACNIPAILAELKRQGFTGFFSIEHEGKGPANLQDIKADRAYFYEQIKSL